MNQSMTSPVSVTSLRYARGFASRLCLILERYLAIEDYEAEAPDPLEEAIAFLRHAERSPAALYNDSSVDVSLVVQRVIERMVQRGYIARETTVRDFGGFAIRTLTGLIQKPRRMPARDVRQIHDFFCTMETVVDALLVEQSSVA